MILSPNTPWFAASRRSCYEQISGPAQQTVNCPRPFISKRPYESLCSWVQNPWNSSYHICFTFTGQMPFSERRIKPELQKIWAPRDTHWGSRKTSWASAGEFHPCCRCQWRIGREGPDLEEVCKIQMASWCEVQMHQGGFLVSRIPGKGHLSATASLGMGLISLIKPESPLLQQGLHHKSHVVW